MVAIQVVEKEALMIQIIRKLCEKCGIVTRHSARDGAEPKCILCHTIASVAL